MNRIAFYTAIETSDREVAAGLLRRWLGGCGLTGKVQESGAGLTYADDTTFVRCRPAEPAPGTAPFFLLEADFIATPDGANLRPSALAPLCQRAGLGANEE